MVEVQRVDRYTIKVNGKRVTATEEQEARIRAMTDEQAERFLRIMGMAE